jgi:AsmA protein
MKSLRDIPIEAGLTGSCNLAELKDVIPMDSITLAGILSVDLKVNGNYAPAKKMFPVTTALIGLKGGIVQTKYYPHPVEKTEMLLEVVNHTGTMQDLVVNIKPLSFLFEGKPFTLNARLENFDDMLYDVQSKGTLDIGKIYKVFSQKGMDLDGFIETDLSLKGRQSDATSGRIGKLSNHGTLMLRDIALRSELYPKPFIIKTGEFRFDQDKVWFDNFLAIYGTSDFHLKGFMKNTINYMLSQGGTLTGDFRMNSDFINIDEFMAFAVVDSAVISAERPETGVVIIPRDLDVNLRAGINKTSFKGLEIKDIQAEVNVKEGIIVLKNTSLEMAGCKANMDATYGSVTPVKGFFDFHIKAVDFDIKRAYNEIGMIREMAPSAGKAEGIVSMDYSIKGILNAEMFPILPSVEGGGIFSIKKVKVYGLKLFNDISKGTEKEGLSNPDMTKVDIKSTIKNNTVTLEQFKFKVKGIRVKISGTTTFDNKLNLKVRLGMGPLGIIGIPMKVTGTSENMKIRYGKGKETDETKESEYTDELSPEMLQRIRNAKEDAGDDDPEK